MPTVISQSLTMSTDWQVPLLSRQLIQIYLDFFLWSVHWKPNGLLLFLPLCESPHPEWVMPLSSPPPCSTDCPPPLLHLYAPVHSLSVKPDWPIPTNYKNIVNLYLDEPGTGLSFHPCVTISPFVIPAECSQVTYNSFADVAFWSIVHTPQVQAHPFSYTWREFGAKSSL